MEINYRPEVCDHCRQSTTYILAIDRGTAQIVKQIARFIANKGVNIVHPRKEMEGRWLTSNEVGNLTRARAHGLIARVKGEPGNYCLTTKGSHFLHGGHIPKFAIRSKVEGKTMGYYDPDHTMVQISDFNDSKDYWEGMDYKIEEGRIVRESEFKRGESSQLKLI